METKNTEIVCTILMVAVIVGVDVLFFRHRTIERWFVKVEMEERSFCRLGGQPRRVQRDDPQRIHG